MAVWVRGICPTNILNVKPLCTPVRDGTSNESEKRVKESTPLGGPGKKTACKVQPGGWILEPQDRKRKEKRRESVSPTSAGSRKSCPNPKPGGNPAKPLRSVMNFITGIRLQERLGGNGEA